MTTLTIVDRSDMRAKLMEKIALAPRETAIVTIDMHRGHLDPEVATMPAAPDDSVRVIAAAQDVLDFARTQGITVIHVVLVMRRLPGRGHEGYSVPFWRAVTEITDDNNRLTPGRRTTIEDHNILGSPGTEIIPALYAEGDFVIDNKKRLDCFHGTDLNLLLQNLGAKNVCLMGINTNTCVLNTAFTAFNHNYAVVVMSDCVASMYGEDLHVLGLENVARCIGWTMSNDEFKAKVAEGKMRNS